MNFKLIIFILIINSTQINSSKNCGKLIESSDNDAKSKSAKWPWFASLYYHFNQQYFCSGTLISERHVLSASHCFSGSNFSTPPQTIFVVINQINFTSPSPNDIITNVTSIKQHPNWKAIDGNFDADIAIVLLTKNVQLTPICLLDIMSIGGVFIGLSKSQNNLSFMDISVKNITSCLIGDENSCSIHSDDFSCASYSSSFYSKNREGIYSLNGLFSKGLRLDSVNECGINNFIVFTFVDQYLNWIRGEMMLDEVNREERVLKDETMDVFCDYRWNYDQSLPLYTCIVRGLIISSRHTKVSNNINGLHGDDDFDSDVDRIHIVKSKILYLPQTIKIAEKFINLRNFWVNKSRLKFIEREKLSPMVNLTILSLSENEIEELSADVFMDLINLEVIWIHSNQIAKLEENLLKNQPKLKVFDARNNLIDFLPSKLFESNKNLKTINLNFNNLKKIDVKFDVIKTLKWVALSVNNCIDLSYCKNFDCLKSLKQLQEAVNGSC